MAKIGIKVEVDHTVLVTLSMSEEHAEILEKLLIRADYASLTFSPAEEAVLVNMYQVLSGRNL